MRIWQFFRKRFWAVLAAVLLAGCSAQKNEEPPDLDTYPTLSILTIGECSPEACARVSQALSEITMERIGCRVELRCSDRRTYHAQIDGLLLESELADIFVCPDRATLNKLLEGNYVYRLNRFLESHPMLYNAVQDDAQWRESSVGEYCYGIPFGNSASFYWGFLMRRDICQSLNKNPASIRDLNDLHDLLVSVQKKYPDIIPVVPDYGNIETYVDYVSLSSRIGVLSPDGSVVSIEDLPDFPERCTTMRNWYQEGLILKNAPFNRLSRVQWLKSGAAFGSFARVGRYTLQELRYICGEDIDCIPLGELRSDANQGDDCFCIYAYSQNVDLCLSLLELIYTDPDVLALCVYGQKGIDYTIGADGAAVPTDLKDGYYSWNWPLRDRIPQPYCTLSHPDAPAGETDGFVFDGRVLANELYQCNAVMEKYYNALCSGMIDPEEGIALMKAEFQSAELDKVLAEKQHQWLQWSKIKAE